MNVFPKSLYFYFIFIKLTVLRDLFVRRSECRFRHGVVRRRWTPLRRNERRSHQMHRETGSSYSRVLISDVPVCIHVDVGANPGTGMAGLRHGVGQRYRWIY